jgi:hypothetical protein
MVLLLALAGAGAGRPREARAGGLPPGLASGDAAERTKALQALDAVLAKDASCGAEALPALREILRARGPKERALVAGLVLKIPGDEALGLWLACLDPDAESDDRVQAAALDATVVRAADAAFARKVVDLSRDRREKPVRRALMIEATGALAGPAPTVVLANGRPDADWVEESCRALGLLRRGTAGGRPARAEVVPPLIALLGHADASPRAHAWEALARLTGQNLPADPRAWAAWWKAHANDPEAPAKAVAPADAARYAPPAPAHVPRYYGVPIQGKGEECRVVFCQDVSASMAKVGLARAVAHLEDAIKAMTTHHSFDVIAFNSVVTTWEGRVVRAHPAQKARALAWVHALESKSETNIYDAVEAAFEEMGRGTTPSTEPVRLDAVFLLSDGEPNQGRYHLPKQVVKGIAELSGGQVPVHTVGAGESVFQLLRDVAAATGGTFVDAFE